MPHGGRDVFKCFALWLLDVLWTDTETAVLLRTCMHARTHCDTAHVVTVGQHMTTPGWQGELERIKQCARFRVQLPNHGQLVIPLLIRQVCTSHRGDCWIGWAMCAYSGLDWIGCHRRANTNVKLEMHTVKCTLCRLHIMARQRQHSDVIALHVLFVFATSYSARRS